MKDPSDIWKIPTAVTKRANAVQSRKIFSSLVRHPVTSADSWSPFIEISVPIFLNLSFSLFLSDALTAHDAPQHGTGVGEGTVGVFSYRVVSMNVSTLRSAGVHSPQPSG